MPQRSAATMLMLLLLLAASSHAEEFVATLTLDGLSFVSFGDRKVLPLPSGSTLVFRFAEGSAKHSASFTIAPDDVVISPISLGAGRSLRYGLARPARGVLRLAGGQRIVEFTGAVTATLSGDPRRSGTFTYEMPFTTERAAATDHAGTKQVQVSGARLAAGAWYGQIVGATVNDTNAYPEPGAAVYTVLSGSFDRLPELLDQ